VLIAEQVFKIRVKAFKGHVQIRPSAVMAEACISTRWCPGAVVGTNHFLDVLTHLWQVLSCFLCTVQLHRSGDITNSSSKSSFHHSQWPRLPA